MARTVVTREIDAPIDVVFDAVAHIESYREAVPGIVKIEVLSETTRGEGARFRETRRIGKREAATELEVTEYVENDRVRLVSDAGGTIWDTVFELRSQGGPTTSLTMTMDARPYKLLAKLFAPLISRVMRKYLEADMDAVKTYCEQKALDDAGSTEASAASG